MKSKLVLQNGKVFKNLLQIIIESPIMSKSNDANNRAECKIDIKGDLSYVLR